MTENVKKPLGRILLQQRAITQPELDKALATARVGGPPLATRLTESGALSEVAALKALSEQSGVPGIDLRQICVRLSDLEIVPREIALRHKLLPVLVRDDRVFVAMAAPADRKVIDELEFVTGKRVYPYIALEGSLTRVINAAYELRERGESFYVGPECPPEILRKAGADAAARPAAAPPGRDPFPEAAAAEPQAAPAAKAARPAVTATLAPKRPPLGSPPLGSAALGSPPPGSPLVIDDAMRRIADDTELNDADFGHLNRDLSVVADFPPVPMETGRSGPKLLIVDDEAEIRRLLRRVFEDRGYQVLEAEEGLTALRLVKEQLPDALILDAMLPEVHGFEIARRIKGTQRYGHVRIVMVSAVYRGWRFAEDLKTSYGVDAYLEKPFRIPEVVAAVENALQQGKGGDDPERISSEAERMLAAGIAAYQAGDFDKAIERLRQGTALDPLAYRLHFHLGLLYGKQGQLYDAIQELETAVQVNSRHFSALKNLAVLYQKAGFRNKAIETWERALAVAPDEGTKKQIKEHILGLL
jgi:DNA-binding response OmpR family regulator